VKAAGKALQFSRFCWNSITCMHKCAGVWTKQKLLKCCRRAALIELLLTATQAATIVP